MCTVQLPDSLQHVQAGANRALGVITMSDRRAEHRHHRVADELLEPPPVVLYVPLGIAVVELERVAHVLRIGSVRSRRESNEVDEEDRDELPLLRQATGVLETGPTAAAEA